MKWEFQTFGQIWSTTHITNPFGALLSPTSFLGEGEHCFNPWLA
jgi:hypothetical protein